MCLVVEPLDMRAGTDSLSLRIPNSLGCSPCDGTAYAFRNRRGNRVKLLIWDGTGVWLCQRRLHKGQFFTGSERAGQRAAAIQTLLGTAKLNGLDPAAWLRDTLEKLPTCLNSQLDSLLPLRDPTLHSSTI